MTNNNYSETTAVVIVLFRPNKEDIDNVNILSENYYGVIIDNSETPNFSKPFVGKMRYKNMKSNVGIAAAHNCAIDIIINERKSRYVVLLDQDSRYSIDYPQMITTVLRSIQQQVSQLVALGPTIIQKETGEEYQSIFHKNKYLTNDIIIKQDIIASGCCIDLNGLQIIGFFDESLFIDFVDTEWCFRAKDKGFIIGITPVIEIQHKVGLGEIHFGKHIVSISSPFRYYYQYRNYIILLVKKYVPYTFKINFGVKLFSRFLYFPFIVKNGVKCWPYMAKGIYAGLKKII